MSRAWVRGKYEEPSPETPEPSNIPSIDNEPVEALIDRDIYRMPRPTKSKHPPPKLPEVLPQTRDQVIDIFSLYCLEVISTSGFLDKT